MKPVDDKVYANSGNRDVLSRVPEACKTVLDVGCGAGDNARVLQQRGCEVDGVTLSTEEARLAEPFCRRVVVGNLEHGLPTGLADRYDAVICSHVLEHICFPGKLLDGIYDRLDEGGLLVVAVPNLLFVKNRLKLLLGSFDYTNTGLMDQTHFRWYTLATGRDLLRERGFSRVISSATGSLPIGPLRSVLPGRMVKAAENFSVGKWPGLFGYQLLHVARKAERPGS